MQNFISDNSVIGHFNIALTVYELWRPSRIGLLPAGLQVAPPQKKKKNLKSDRTLLKMGPLNSVHSPDFKYIYMFGGTNDG